MAKGIEDTTFYRWHRLIALDEVGGDPRSLDAPDAERAARLGAARRPQRCPHGPDDALDARHQAQRGRARAPAGRRRGPRRLGRLLGGRAAARRRATTSTSRPPTCSSRRCSEPGRSSSSGSSPTWRRRSDEAKQFTSWSDPDERYEVARRAISPRAASTGDIAQTVRARASRRTPAAIRATTLGSKLLQLTLPGVPDVYQGNEIVAPALVDPDNRRPVDYARRAALLARLGDGAGAARPRRRRSCWVTTPRAAPAPRAARRCSARAPATRRWPRARPHALGFVRGGERRDGRHALAAACSRRSGWARRTRDAARPAPGTTCSPARARRRRRRVACEAAARRPAGRAAGEGVVSFRVWAPSADGASTLLLGDERHAMRAGRGRLVGGRRAPPRPATAYAFAIDGGEPRADPRALCAARRARRARRGRRPRARSRGPTSPGAGVELPGAVIYELHVGTFTPEGTLDAAIERLDHLVDARRRHRRGDAARDVPRSPRLGLRRRRPVRGARAVRRPATRSQRFVDACHARGLGRLPRRRLQPPRPERQPPRASSARTSPTATARRGARPSTSTAPAATRCGASSSTTRCMWLRDFHVDGLRLDAVHALFDDARDHAARGAVGARSTRWSARLGRPLWLIAESDRNDPLHGHAARGAAGSGIDAQWADDVHHALHVAADRRDAGLLRRLRRARARSRRCSRASSSTTARTRRSASARTVARVDRAALPGWRFVVSLQTHDQVGNRAHGDRLSARSRPGRLACGAALLLTSAGHADALHGRGVGRVDALAVLHRPHRPRDRRGRAPRPARRVRRPRLGARRRARPAGAADVRALAARLGRAAPRAARDDCSPGTATSSPLRRDAARPARPAARPGARRARRRGADGARPPRRAHVVAVNLATASGARSCLPSADLSVVLAWEPAGVGARRRRVTLAGESAAILGPGKPCSRRLSRVMPRPRTRAEGASACFAPEHATANTPLEPGSHASQRARPVADPRGPTAGMRSRTRSISPGSPTGSATPATGSPSITASRCSRAPRPRS